MVDTLKNLVFTYRELSIRYFVRGPIDVWLVSRLTGLYCAKQQNLLFLNVGSRAAKSKVVNLEKISTVILPSMASVIRGP